MRIPLPVGAGLAVLLLAVGLGGVASALGAVMDSRTQVPSVAPTRQAAASFDRKLRSAEKTVLLSRGVEPVRLTLTEEELTSKLREIVGEWPEGVALEDPEIRLLPDEIHISGLVPLGPVRTRLSTSVRLRVEGGALAGGVQTLHLGRMRMPAPLTSNVLRLLLDASGGPALPSSLDLTDFSLLSLPDGLHEIVIEEGRITLGLALPVWPD